MEWIVSLTPEVSTEPLDALKSPPEGAGVVELRVDLFPGIDVSAVVAASPIPVLATVRSTAEGGRGPCDPQTRERLLEAARDSGASLIDVEVARDVAAIDRLGLDPDRLVLSWHDPEGTPEDLEERAERMLESSARWVKLVPTAHSLSDLRGVLSLQQQTRSDAPGRRRLIPFSMGAVGLPSRYLSPVFAAPIGFSAWREGAEAAPGQASIERLRLATEHLVGPPEKIFAVVGGDARTSLSPVMHGAGYGGLELPYLFVPVTVRSPADLPHVFAPAGGGLFAGFGSGLSGLAVTRPYKRAAVDAATVAAPRARRARAANTLIPGPSRLLAENTDADGVRAALVSGGVDPAGCIAVVQGTGGAGRGAAVGLDLAGCEVFLRGRNAQKTVRVSEDLGVRWLPPEGRSHGASILVNAAPLSEGDVLPFTSREIENADAVVDLVYGSRPTPLVAEAMRRRRVVVDGFEVLLFQGYAQFAAMTGRLPPREAMREAVERFRAEGPDRRGG